MKRKLALLTLLAGCGGEVASIATPAADSGSPPISAPDDAAVAREPDAAIDVDSAPPPAASAIPNACFGPCLPGESTCLPDGLATCAVDSNGCNVWGPATACGTDRICEHTLIRATCVCRAGTIEDGGTCIPVIGAPRPIAPLSTATVTSRTPSFRWTLAPTTDGAQIDLCADRACSKVTTTFSALGTSTKSPIALATGVHFWRAHGTANGVVGTETSPTWELVVGHGNAAIDTSWGSLLDVDGDGLADIIVASTNATGNVDLEVYAGNVSGVTTPTVIHGAVTGAGSFGVTKVHVASAGDVNGDGYADVIVAAAGVDVSFGFGSLSVYLGGPNGLGVTPIATSLEFAGFYNARIANTAAGASDVNGDGYADIVASTPYNSDHVNVFPGGPNGTSSVPIAIASTGASDFGDSVAGAGDVNGDGFGDIVVGASQEDGLPAALYLGGPNGPLDTPIELAIGSSTLVSGAGDVDGDGRADIVTGAGALYFGAANGVAPNPTLLPFPPNAFAVALTAAGDTNGDGLGDVLIGTLDQFANKAHAVLFVSGASVPITLSGSTLTFGNGVAGAGDIDGDGLADILVGEPGQGTVSVFSGRATGLSTLPVVLKPFTNYGFE